MSKTTKCERSEKNKMTKPITPQDVKRTSIPNAVIEVWNAEIAAAWNGTYAAVLLQPTATKISEKLKISVVQVYNLGYVAVEGMYREVGWTTTFTNNLYADDSWHPAYVFIAPSSYHSPGVQDQTGLLRPAEATKRKEDTKESLRDTKKEPEQNPNAPIKTFEVWTEGYCATGDEGKAIFHGEFKGRTFREAVEAFAKTKGADTRVFIDLERLTFWGCEFFSNEKDARASYG